MSKEVLLPGEVNLSTEDFDLIADLLEAHFNQVRKTQDKVNHLLKSDENSKRYGGTVTQNLLNNYLDYQDNRLGEYKDSLFGKPLN